MDMASISPNCAGTTYEGKEEVTKHKRHAANASLYANLAVNAIRFSAERSIRAESAGRNCYRLSLLAARGGMCHRKCHARFPM